MVLETCAQLASHNVLVSRTRKSEGPNGPVHLLNLARIAFSLLNDQHPMETFHPHHAKHIVNSPNIISDDRLQSRVHWKDVVISGDHHTQPDST